MTQKRIKKRDIHVTHKKRDIHLTHKGLPRSTEQTQVTGEQLARDINSYYKILAKKHNVSNVEFDENTLIDTAQAILNTYKTEHRWIDITDINMNPVGYYIFNGDKAKMHEAMKKELANPTKRPSFLWFRKKWWKFKHSHKKNKKSK